MILALAPDRIYLFHPCAIQAGNHSCFGEHNIRSRDSDTTGEHSMKKYLIGLIVAAIVLSAGGCGRKKSTIPTSLPKGEQTRALAVGDRMVYDLAVSVTNAKGINAGTAQGKVTVKVQKADKHQPVPADVKKTYHISEVMEVQDIPTGQIAWVGQGTDGTIYFLGRLEQGKDWSLVQGKKLNVDTPAILADGKSWGYTTKLSGGKTETDTYKIVGTERVKTPAGEFEAYKAESETKLSDGRHAKGFIWLRPEFPRPIKIRLDLSNVKQLNRSITSVEQVLSSYKFAKP